MKASLVACVTVAACLGLAAPSVHAAPITVGMIDTFQTGNDGWFAGGGPLGQQPPIPPHTVLGGPTGANDAFLLVTANGGSGPGSRLVTMNDDQWAGVYDSATIGTIEMDLRNFGATNLEIRLLFEDPLLGPPPNVAVSTVAASLLSGGGWTHVAFSIDPNDLTALAGSAAGALANTTVLRIFHSSNPSFPGETVAGLLGIDNISAGFVPRPGPFDSTAVPEPTSLLLLGTGIAGIVRYAHRRRP